MADKVCDYFPHIFKPTRNYEDILGGFFEADHFAQLAVSNLLPQQCKSFSNVSLSASVQNLDEWARLCYCLAPVNFFTHALITFALGQYTRDVKEAMEKLGNYIEAEKKHTSCFLQMAKEDKISEKQILLVYAHHLFEPLLPDAKLFIDKYIGVDATECPYCKEKKEKIQSGSTSFGVPKMWHGRADIVLKHGKIQQTVTVTQPSDTSVEPPAKKQKMDYGDSFRSGLVERKKDLNWDVTSKGEQDQDPIPQILSQTIVNAFLVIKENWHLRNFFIPSFLVTPKGVMTVMYNAPYDSLVSQIQSVPLVTPDNTINRRIVFIIWLALNFDKFQLDQSVETIKKFLKPCGFRESMHVHGIQESYERDVCEGVEEKCDKSREIYPSFLDKTAIKESWSILNKHIMSDLQQSSAEFDAP